MTFPAIRVGRVWSTNSVLASSELATIDTNFGSCIDGNGGGVYTPSVAITVNGSFGINSARLRGGTGTSNLDLNGSTLTTGATLALAVGSTMTVSGNVTCSTGLTVNGVLTANNSITCNGLSVLAAATFSAGIGVIGASTFNSVPTLSPGLSFTSKVYPVRISSTSVFTETIVGGITQPSTAGAVLTWQVAVPTGITLYSVTVWLVPAVGHTGLPTTMPVLQIGKANHANNTYGALASITDGSSLSGYNLGHALTASFGAVTMLASETLYVTVGGEGGTNATSGLAVGLPMFSGTLSRVSCT